jgi:CheY-like chemotaxis protein
MGYICTGEGNGVNVTRETQRQGDTIGRPGVAGPGQVEVGRRTQPLSVSAAGQVVLVTGPWLADMIFRGLSRPTLPGTEVFAEEFSLLPGGAFTLAMALHRLGHEVVWATDFGNDLFSQHVLSVARAEGLNEIGFRHHRIPLRSLTVVFSYPSDRAMTTYQDLGSREDASMIRVAVVNDQPLVRTGIAMLIDAEDDITVVAQAADGQEALVQVRAERPDVVLMDVRMPGTDGIAATRAIIDEGLTAQNGQPIRIIILTIYHVDEAVEAALRAGASGFLLKSAIP